MTRTPTRWTLPVCASAENAAARATRVRASRRGALIHPRYFWWSARQIFFPFQQRHKKEIQERDAELKRGSGMEENEKRSAFHLGRSSFPNRKCIDSNQINEYQIGCLIAEAVKPIREIRPHVKDESGRD